jgi:dihydrofolate reductase
VLVPSWAEKKEAEAKVPPKPEAVAWRRERGRSADEFPAVVPSTHRRRERTMREIIVCTFLTLDGVMQAPGGPDEDAESGFEYGGWQKPVSDDEVGAAIAGWYQHSDAMLLGRKTYEIFASYWPTADPDNPFTGRMNSMHKYVASRTLTSVEWQNSTLLEGDIVDAVRRLKASDGGNINVVGSGDLAQTLTRNGLVDEYRLTIHPVIIGTGKRLFADGAIPTALEPVSVSTTKGGTVLGVYRTNGKPSYDSY